MPYISIKSLPFTEGVDVSAAAAGICNDFARQMRIPPEQVTVLWETLLPHAYVTGGKAGSVEKDDLHPIIIDLLVPDFYSRKSIADMLSRLAEIVAQHAQTTPRDLFINCRLSRSGMVYDHGELLRW